jgi:hypothetical protein
MVAAFGDHALDERLVGRDVVDQSNDEAGTDNAILRLSRRGDGREHLW